MQRVLIIQTSSLGDVVLSTALAETLHDHFPDCIIDFLIKKGYESLFEGHPFINKVLVWDKKSNKYKNLFSILKIVRHQHYDLVVNIHRHISTGLLTILSGASQRAGFKKNPMAFAFTHSVPHLISATGTEHEIVRNHRLIDNLVNGNPSRPRLYPTTKDIEKVLPWTNARFITVSPASLWNTKQFPSHKWVEFLDQVEDGTKVYLLGAANDAALCNDIINRTQNKNIISLAGQLSMLQSAALMQHAVMNFVNDSAPMHLASATNSPVTAIFCSTVTGFGFGPLSDDSAVVETTEALDCRPCGLHGHKACPKQHFKCAETIPVKKLNNRIAPLKA